MKPSDKAPAIASALETAAQNAFGRSRIGSIMNDTCVCCGKPATEFKDDICRKEFAISGFCQVCQDEVLGGEDEEVMP